MFSTVESQVTKSGRALGLFKKDWHDIIYDMKNTQGFSNKLKAAFSNTISQTDIENIRKYNTAINNGVTSQTAFNQYLRNSSASAQNLAASANGAAVSEEALNTATRTSTIALKAQQIAMNLLANAGLMVIITLISKGVKAFGDLINNVEITREKVDELTSTFKTELDTANSNAKRVEDLADKYEELSKGVNNLGENVSLTNEEYKEYTSLANEIADMFPTLVQGYTDEGNAILNLKGNVEELRDAYKEAQQEAYNLLIASGEDTNGNDIIKQWNDLHDTGFWASTFDLGTDNVDKGISVSDALEQLKAIQNMTAEEYREIERIVGSGSSEELSQLSDIELQIGYGNYLKGALGVSWNVSDEDFAEAKRQAVALIQTYNAEIQAGLSDVETLADAYLNTNDTYDNLDSQVKTATSKMINSLDANIANGFKSKEDVGAYVDDVVKIISNNSDVQNAMVSLFTLDTSDMPVGEIETTVHKYVQIIANALGENVNTLKDRLGFGDIGDELDRAYEKFGLKTDGSSRQSTVDKRNFLAGLNIEDLNYAMQIPDLFEDGLDGAAKKIEEFKKENPIEVHIEFDKEKTQKAYDELSSAVSEFTSNQKSLNDALKEQEEHGQLSASTIQSLTEAGYAQALAIDAETGAVTLNVTEYERLNEQKRAKIQLDLQNEKSELTEKLKEEEQAVFDLRSEYEALAKADMEANSGRLSEIALELAKRGENIEAISGLITQINSEMASLNAPEFDSGSDKKDPKQVTDFLDEYNRRQHEIAMGRMAEDQDYYDWLESAAEKAYAGLKDYEEDLWKYQEEVYAGRKQLADDYLNDRIEDREAQIEITLDTSKADDGTLLNIDEKFDYVRDCYNEILAEIQTRINSLLQSGVASNSDVIQELEKQYEEYVKKIDELSADEIDEHIDFLNNRLDNRIEGLEAQVEITLDTSKSDDGTKLNVEEKFDYVRDCYQEVINEIEDCINDLIEKGVDTDSEVIKELEKQAQEYRDKLDGVLTDEIETEIDYLKNTQDEWNKFYDDKIDTIEKEKSAMEERYDSEIEALQKANDEKQKEYDIEKARQELEKASQRTRKVYGANGNVEYRQDTEAIAEAQKNLDDLLVEKQIEALEAQKELETEKFDKEIELLEQEQTAKQEFYNKLLEILENYLNPKATESNSNVWESVLGDTENVKKSNGNVEVKGADVDTSSLKKGILNSVDIINWLEKLGASTDIIKAYATGTGNTTTMAMQTSMNNTASKQFDNQHKTSAWSASRDDYKLASANQNENVTYAIGDIHIHNPVGNSNDLATEFAKHLTLAIHKQTYTNLKK